MVADSHSIMTRWTNYFSELLNVHGAKEVEPSAFEVELAIEKLKSHKSPGID